MFKKILLTCAFAILVCLIPSQAKALSCMHVGGPYQTAIVGFYQGEIIDGFMFESVNIGHGCEQRLTVIDQLSDRIILWLENSRNSSQFQFSGIYSVSKGSCTVSKMEGCENTLAFVQLSSVGTQQELSRYRAEYKRQEQEELRDVQVRKWKGVIKYARITIGVIMWPLLLIVAIQLRSAKKRIVVFSLAIVIQLLTCIYLYEFERFEWFFAIWETTIWYCVWALLITIALEVLYILYLRKLSKKLK